MIILKNRKEIFRSTDHIEVFNFFITKIKITNFKQLTPEMGEVIKTFVESNEQLNWQEGLHSFSKLFNKAKTNQQIDYWLARGWTYEEAIEKISCQSKKASGEAAKAFAEMKKDKNIWDNFKATRTSTLEYYIDKGLSIEEAKVARKERQATFSREKLIEKHGEEEAEKILTIRNKKWLGSMKANHDWENLSKRKAMTLENMIKKYGEEEGTEKYHNWKENVVPSKNNYIKKFGNQEGEHLWDERFANWKGKSNSKSALLFFNPIITELKKIFDDDEIFIGDTNGYEYWLKYGENNIFFYDLTIRPLNLIIEFHGIHVHPNPSWEKNKWDIWRQAYNKKTAAEVRDYDTKKKALAENQGFRVIEVWSDENLPEKQEIIINEIKNLFTILI